MSHPLAVAQILAGMRMDLVSIETGLLHDVVEDTSVTAAEIRKSFGEEVARCVDGVTKLSKIDFFSAEDRQAESYRKMLLAMVNDIRVIIVKLADRLHNMRTLGSLSPERRERIARETLDIYAPIAHRLGMGKVRGELEDLAFLHIEPEAAAKSRAPSRLSAPTTKNIWKDALHRRSGAAPRRHSGARAGARQARLLRLPEAQTPEDHARPGLRPWSPAHRHRFGKELLRRAGRHPQRVVPGAWPNQRLHRDPAAESLSVPAHFGRRPGRPPRNPDRTEEMHRIAEEGIAAHWKYKEGKRGVRRTISGWRGCGSSSNGSRTCGIRAISFHAERGPLPRRGLLLSRRRAA